ncbi:MAG: hypothetical protein J0M08_04150 [Bacteroidetes bacterium]|nr:hypothetical protein [Bacteroidota bacterium]
MSAAYANNKRVYIKNRYSESFSSGVINTEQIFYFINDSLAFYYEVKNCTGSDLGYETDTMEAKKYFYDGMCILTEYRDTKEESFKVFTELALDEIAVNCSPQVAYIVFEEFIKSENRTMSFLKTSIFV